ncbi:hypothetical protein A3F08_01280 [Candidatus Berkelbacteria bacterium RIFCSPHIGHO2_12_FULL_36_9]|uniref:Uncharacterized protein n=1 Tax=Candidatus Berkelbacteria bacterium RIFCSPHIGHO2_12_FULL_36_9 TaxID=1797469 RepID=A0A1F5EF54_9BACT|nr:MAG: hypothetical protein A3F08_01280 [Candidatus Berkelbacteria bacterium RIFCSPHIGHO2_12_FULL_36_9]
MNPSIRRIKFQAKLFGLGVFILVLFFGMNLATPERVLAVQQKVQKYTRQIFKQNQKQPISVKIPNNILVKSTAKNNLKNTTLAAGWNNIMSETFENGFPQYNGWSIRADSGSPSWEERLYRVYNGTWSAWAAGTSETAYSSHTYPNNMTGWMIYGPFSLADASDAQLNFYYWNKSEPNYDYLRWGYSTDGNNFSYYP